MGRAAAAAGGSRTGFEPRLRTMSTAENHLNKHPVELVLDRLRAAGKRVRQSRPDQWEAQCPAHDDGSPSLGINETPIGKVLLHCHAGCQVPEICRALDLRTSDLFPDTPTTGGSGLQERARYLYADEHGEVLFTVVRYIDLATGKKTFRAHGSGKTNMKGVRRVPYNLPQLYRARAEGKRAWITEGEKDAENLQWHVDGAVTTNPFGADNWDASYNEHFRDMDVTIVADDDVKGRGHADQVAIHLSGIARSVTVLLPAEGCKDITDHLNAGHALAELRPLEGATEPTQDDEPDEWDPSSTLVETARQIRAGEREKLLPDTLLVEGAVPLLYPGRTNSIFGESGGGKSWLELWAALEAARAGKRVAIIDYEDSEDGIAERLIALGATDEEIARIDYFNPASGIGLGVDKFEERQTEYGHVYIDSSGEAMAAAGVDPNVDPEVARWFTVVRRLTRMANKPGVTILDHVPKATDAPSAYAIGSQRKRAAITGASYRVETIEEPAKGKSGKLKLIVAKDRGGNRPKGTVAAIVDLIASEDGTLRIELRAPVTEQDGKNGERVRPAELMQRISEFVEATPGASVGVIKQGVGGNAQKITDALVILRNEGFMRGEMKGQSLQHFVDKKYRRMLDPLVSPVDKSGSSSPVPPFQPIPTHSGNEARVPVPPVPTPLGGTGSGTGTGTATAQEPFPVDNSGAAS